MSVLPRLRRQARVAAAAALLAVPALVRSDAVETAMRREHVRRLGGRDADRARRQWRRHLRSRNRRASLAAVEAVAGVRDARPLLDDLQTAVSARPDDVVLRLGLSAALRRVGRVDDAADVLSGVHAVTGDDVPALLREAVAVVGRPGLAPLVSRLAPRDDDARRLLAAASLADLATSPLAEVLGQHEHDEDVLVVAAAVATGLAEQEDVARAALAHDRVPGGVLGPLAATLRDAGDLRLSTELARRVLERHPSDPAARRTVRMGESGLRTLEDGWRAPERASRSDEPVERRVHYLLHSSLPHTTLGYATRTHGLLRALRTDGWDVRGITQPGYPEDVPDAAPSDDVDGVPYRRLPHAGPLPHWPVERMVTAYSRALEPVVRDERPEILHAASNFRNGLAAVDVGRRLGIPTIYEVRGLWHLTRLVREPDFDRTDSFALLERLETQAASLADHCLVITRALADHLVDRGVDGDRVTVVPNGVDTDRFRPRERDVELAARLGIGDRVVIGYVGGLVEYEGLHLLVEAAHLLRQERDDFRVLVVGDGRSLPALRAAAVDRGIADTVVFTGRVPHHEVERYYSLVDVAPFPRTADRVTELVSPLKPFEAMAMGKAVVASDVPALAEIIDDGVTGRLFEAGSAPALAAVLRALLDSPAHRSALADEGLAWVRRERDWRALAPVVEAVYADLTGRGRR